MLYIKYLYSNALMYHALCTRVGPLGPAPPPTLLTLLYLFAPNRACLMSVGSYFSPATHISKWNLLIHSHTLVHRLVHSCICVQWFVLFIDAVLLYLWFLSNLQLNKYMLLLARDHSTGNGSVTYYTVHGWLLYGFIRMKVASMYSELCFWSIVLFVSWLRRHARIGFISLVSWYNVSYSRTLRQTFVGMMQLNKIEFFIDRKIIL